MTSVLRQLLPSIRAMLFFTLFLGLAFPLVTTGLAQLIFPDQANGSIIERDGAPVASSLIGQSFIDPETGRAQEGYFRGRPSAVNYGAVPSGGSNLGPTSAELHDRIVADAQIIREENRLEDGVLIPVDLVTTSGSGLDPHISPASAELQVSRVARERDLDEDVVRRLVHEHTEGRALGFLGEPRVNVVELNLALDELER